MNEYLRMALCILMYRVFAQAEGERTIVLKAMGKAINKTVTIAEILKRKLPLHQITSLSSCEMIDVFEPLEEGLDVVTNRRHVSCIKVTLSLEEMDTNHVGYQPPLPFEEIQPGDAALGEGNRGTRPSRGSGITTQFRNENMERDDIMVKTQQSALTIKRERQ